MEKSKKVFSIILALLMVLSLISTALVALADETQPNPKPQNVKVQVSDYYSNDVHYSGDGTLVGNDGTGNYIPLEQIEYVYSGGLMIDTAWDNNEDIDDIDLTVVSTTPEATQIFIDGEGNVKPLVEKGKRSIVEFDTRTYAEGGAPEGHQIYLGSDGLIHTQFFVPVLGHDSCEEIIDNANALVKTKVTGEGEATFDDVTDSIEEKLQALAEDLKKSIGDDEHGPVSVKDYYPAYLPGNSENPNPLCEDTQNEVNEKIADVLNYSDKRNAEELSNGTITESEISLNKEEMQAVINAVTEGMKDSNYSVSAGAAEGDTISVFVMGNHYNPYVSSDFTDPVSFVVDNKDFVKTHTADDLEEQDPESTIIHYVFENGKKAADDVEISVGQTVPSPKIDGYTPDMTSVTYTGAWLESITVTYKKNPSTSIKDAKITAPAVTYNKKTQTPNITVVLNGETLKKDTDYTVAYSNNKNAGTATAVITGKGKYAESQTVKFTINKAKNTFNSKGKTVKVKYSDLKNSKITVKQQKILSISKPQGKISYSKKSGNKNIGINKKSGKLVIKKGLAKGTYKIKIKVKAAGNKNYKAKTKTITVKVKVN